MNTAIIIMAKVPTAGNVKTRLQPYLTPEQCVELAECFLLDTVSKAELLQNQIIIKLNSLYLLFIGLFNLCKYIFYL